MFPALYHAHYQSHLEDLPFWLEMAGRAEGPILELGCGTGRVLIPLALQGVRTFGLDHNREMLDFLHTRLIHELDPAQHPLPGLFQAEISAFHLYRPFPLIILPCNTWSTLLPSVRQAALGCIRAHLQPGGFFITSLPNPVILLDLPASEESEVEEDFIHPITGNPVQVSSAWERDKSRLTVAWHYDHLLPDGIVERITVHAAHTLTTAQGYRGELGEAGLELVNEYGDFDASPYTSDSDHLILVARKPS